LAAPDSYRDLLLFVAMTKSKKQPKILLYINSILPKKTAGNSCG